MAAVSHVLSGLRVTPVAREHADLWHEVFDQAAVTAHRGAPSYFTPVGVQLADFCLDAAMADWQKEATSSFKKQIGRHISEHLGWTRQKMTQAELARAMRTSRTVVHRLLDPHDTSVTLATLSKASKALGVKLLQVA